jgi:predicted MPP superfamily phosphohydrolase
MDDAHPARLPLPQVDRRMLLSAGAAAALGLPGYAFAIEPSSQGVTRYAFTPPRWPADLRLKIALIADVHACEPWMPASRVRTIADMTNRLDADLVLLAGDYSAGHRFVSAPVMPQDWGEALSVLRAPLGVFSVLGNHDWWHGPLMTMPGDGAKSVRQALTKAGIRVLENTAVKLVKDGQLFWLLGLGDQMAVRSHGRPWFRGLDDLPGTLGQVVDDAPVLLLAHEPFIFSRVPERIALTLAGHTHGGQINLPFFGPPFAPTWHNRRYTYGHIVDGNRHLIISGGLGTSHLPIRFLRPPEIVEITLGDSAA